MTGQTGTDFPKKIFLAPDVNAAVFYNSTFWSMFLPIRKNLMIGLGLVNSVNVTEFKAVMAHEFGHFSQRSMKLGSFTYNVNKVIHNMLYENTGYTKFLQGWGRIHGILAFFARVTFWIAEGIQWILRAMYKMINKNYMGLSREMEFHADAVAASVAGGNNVISGLSRIGIADNCYHTVLGEAEGRARHHQVSKNLFANQLTVFRSFGDDNRCPLEKGIPVVSYAFVTGYSRSRINFRNQWASHPTLEERKQSLDAVGKNQAPDVTSAWSLFTGVEALQERMTAHLYRNAKFKEATSFYDGVDFERDFLERKRRYALPAGYRGFYFGRFIDIGDWDLDALAAGEGADLGGSASARGAVGTAGVGGGFGAAPAAGVGEGFGAAAAEFDELFNDATGQLQRAIDFNNKDIQLALAIKQKQIDVKSFDFDGVKYDREDGEMIAEQLKREVADQRKQQGDLDKKAFLFFVRLAGARAEELVAGYREFQRVKRRYDEYITIVNAVIEKVKPFYGGTIGIDAVERIVRELKVKEEADMKAAYRGLLTNERFGGLRLRERMQAFIDADYAYFANRKYVGNEVEDMKALAVQVAGELNEYQFAVYKRTLEVQAEFAPLA